jgi:hypothetical protein
MDTRNKIINLGQASRIAADLRDQGVRWKVVTSYFDVLTVDLVRRLRELSRGETIVAIVLDPPEPLLGPRARAELAAGLSMIDYVLPLQGAGLDHALEELRPDTIVREETADRRRQAALMEHVHRRQRA